MAKTYCPELDGCDTNAPMLLLAELASNQISTHPAHIPASRHDWKFMMGWAPVELLGRVDMLVNQSDIDVVTSFSLK
jgi:hypothetical protein